MKAICIEHDGVFTLKAGSIISPYELLGLSKKMKLKRDSANIKDNILQEDVDFESLYHAACFVIGTNASDKWFVLQ